jgi:hypothetical protein
MSVDDREASVDVAEDWIRQCLRDHGQAELTVTGSCMAPALAEGVRVHLVAISTAPRVGDVVLLRTSAGLRLHRVLFRSGGHLRTKGDRGVFLDHPTRETAVLAVCRTGETVVERWIRAIRSVVRLTGRFGWRRGRPSGDEAHARLLP